MTAGYRSKPIPDASSTEAALDAMDADGKVLLGRVSEALAAVPKHAPAGTNWLEGIRDEYRRYPALQRELGGRKRRA